jgi:putative hydrolase of the HAD superfamily
LSESIHAILFDLDDTLFDHQHSTRCALRGMQQAVPQLAAIPLTDLEYVHRHLLDTLHGQVLRGNLTLEAARLARFQHLLHHFDIHTTRASLVDLASRYRAIYQAERRAIPGVHALLHALRPHIQLGIITNNLAQEQYEKLRVCDLDTLFDCIIISAEVGVAKPDPAIFQLTLNHLKCAPQQAMMVGDSWTVDIIPAAALGLRTVWLTRYGMACPAPEMAAEICAFEPLEATFRLLLQPG